MLLRYAKYNQIQFTCCKTPSRHLSMIQKYIGRICIDFTDNFKTSTDSGNDCVCTNSQYWTVSLLPHSLGMRLGSILIKMLFHIIIRICQLHALLPPLVAWQAFYKAFAGKSSSQNWTSQSCNTATDALQYYNDVL